VSTGYPGFLKYFVLSGQLKKIRNVGGNFVPDHRQRRSCARVGRSDRFLHVPVVSVFIPTKDRLTLLQRAVASVRASSLADFELVISDNSTDEASMEWVLSLHDPRIRLVRWTEPLSKAEHWSRAAEACSGDLVFKLDDDDAITPLFLEKTVRFLHQHPEASAVYTGYRIRRSDQEEPVQDQVFWSAKNPRLGLEYLRAVLLNEGGYPLNQKTAGVFRRDAAKALGWFRNASEDFAFSAVLGLTGAVGYLPEVLYDWHWHEANGVKDWPGSYRLSREALRGIGRLDLPMTRELDWTGCLRKARRNVAGFYLVVALAERPPGTAEAVWNVISEDSELQWDLRLHAARFVSLVLPQGVWRWLLEAYKHGFRRKDAAA
jgi:glycosyltransferase involved in cell wall biosynthesis